MNHFLFNSIQNNDEQELMNFLNINNDITIDITDYDLIEKALLATWHQQHEDLVCTIYLEGLRDDGFVQPILNIALKKEIYRPYDLELESTLRKCVHALKTIDTQKSKLAIEKLEALNNENIKFALEMYQ